MERMHRRPPDVEEALSSMLWTPYERTPTDSSSEDEDEQLNRKLHKSKSTYQYRSQEYEYCSGSTIAPTPTNGLTLTNDSVATIEPTLNNVLTPFVPSLINSNNSNINNSITCRKIERCENFRFSYPHYGPIPSLQQKCEKTEPPSYESLYANNATVPVLKKLIASHNYPSCKNVTPLLTVDRNNDDSNSVTTNYEQTWCDNRNRMVHSFTDNFIIGSSEVVQDSSQPPPTENDVIENCHQPSTITNEFSKSSSASEILQKQTIGKEITDCISGNVDSIQINSDDFNIFEDYSNDSNQCGSTNAINNHNDFGSITTDGNFKSQIAKPHDHEHDPNCKYKNYQRSSTTMISNANIFDRNNSQKEITTCSKHQPIQPQQHQRTLSSTIVANNNTPTNNRVQTQSQCVPKVSHSSDFNVSGRINCNTVESCSSSCSSVHSVKLSDIFLNSYSISSTSVTLSSLSTSSSSSLLSLKSPSSSNQLTENTENTENTDNTLDFIRSSESAIIKRNSSNNNLNICKKSNDNNNIENNLTYFVGGVINDRINKNLNQITAMRLNIPAAASLASTTSLAAKNVTANSNVFLTTSTTTTASATATTTSVSSSSKSPNYYNINNNNNCIAISSCPMQGLQIFDQQKTRTTIGPSLSGGIAPPPIETEIIQPSLTIHVNESNNNKNHNNKNHNNNNNNNNRNNGNCQKDILGNNFVVNANNKGISVVNCSYRNSDSNNIITSSSSSSSTSSSNKCNNSTTGRSSSSSIVNNGSNGICNINHNRSSGCSVPNLNNCVNNNNLNINHFNNNNNNNNNQNQNDNDVNVNDNENSYSDNHHVITTTSDDINIVQRYKNHIIATKMSTDIIPSNVVIHGPPSINYHNHNNVNINNNNTNRCKDNNNTSNSIGLPKTTISSLPSPSSPLSSSASASSSSSPSSQSTTPQRTFISTECQTDDLQAIVRDESRNGDASGNGIISAPIPGTDSGPLTTLPLSSDALSTREQRRRERRERRHQHAQMARNRHPHILPPPPPPQMISNGMVTTGGILRPMLPDILHSHYPPPYSALPLTNSPSRPNSSLIAPVMTAVPITAAATAVGDGRFTIPLPIIRRSPSERSGKGCCGQWFAGPPLRALIAVVALGGVACALGGAALGATGLAGPPSSHLTAALLMIGVGVILVTVSGAAWRMTAPGGPPCLGLGSSVDLGRCGRRPCSRGGGAPHGLLYPEFQHRPPPPSYQASMQEYRLRLLLLDRDRQNGVVRGSSPPPTYRSHAGSLLRTPLTTTNRGIGTGGLTSIGGPGSEYSLPPSYRSRNTNTNQTVVASVTNVNSRPTSVVGVTNDSNVTTTTATVNQPQQNQQQSQQSQSNGIRLTTISTAYNNLPEYTSLQEAHSRILNIGNQQTSATTTPVPPTQTPTSTMVTTPEIQISTTTANEIHTIAQPAKENRRQDITTNTTTYLVQNFNEKLNPRVLSNNCNNFFNLNSNNYNQLHQHQHPQIAQQQMSTTNSNKTGKKDLVTIVTISAGTSSTDPSVNGIQPQQLQQSEMEILAHL